MKIIGFTYHNGERVLIMKGDSALQVNRKPFFIPDCTGQLAGYPVMALRVCKLGKNIAAKFASRYIDTIAPAMDLQAADMRDKASQAGSSWTTAVSLDGSFPVGEFTPVEEVEALRIEADGQTIATVVRPQLPAEAIVEISRYITIRQGDILYVPLREEPIVLQGEQRISGAITVQGEEKDVFFCKIK